MLHTDPPCEPSPSFLCLRCFPDVSESISLPFWLITALEHLRVRPIPDTWQEPSSPWRSQHWCAGRDSSCKGKGNFSTLQKKRGLLQSNLVGRAWHGAPRAGSTHRTQHGLALPGLSQVLMGKDIPSYTSLARSWDLTENSFGKPFVYKTNMIKIYGNDNKEEHCLFPQLQYFSPWQEM